MASILLIETSTALCSVALAVDGKVVAERQSGLDRSHASRTAVYCDEVLREAGLSPKALDAVCISDGPGSYTGLRVGLSTAKGLCFGTGARLLSVSSLDVLAAQGVQRPSRFALSPSQTSLGPSPCMCPGVDTVSATPWVASHIVPMIDARRMEVYTAVYDAEGRRTGEIEAKVIESGAFADIAADTLFIGDGALKCKDIIGAGEFVEAYPTASAMAQLAEKEYAAENFRDVAYFEPFYLKDFVVTQSKKKLF